MYKVSYYMTGGTQMSTRSFATFAEATQFAIAQPKDSVVEIKLYPDENKKKEDRT